MSIKSQSADDGSTYKYLGQVSPSDLIAWFLDPNQSQLRVSNLRQDQFPAYHARVERHERKTRRSKRRRSLIAKLA